MLVSASKDSTLKLWDLKTFKIRVDLPGHSDEVYCVDFVADKIASGGRDKKVKMCVPISLSHSAFSSVVARWHAFALFCEVMLTHALDPHVQLAALDEAVIARAPVL